MFSFLKFRAWRRRSVTAPLCEPWLPPLPPLPPSLVLYKRSESVWVRRCDIHPNIQPVSLLDIKGFLNEAWLLSLSLSLPLHIITVAVTMATERHRWRAVSPLYIYSVAVATTQTCTKDRGRLEEEDVPQMDTDCVRGVFILFFSSGRTRLFLSGCSLKYMAKSMWTPGHYTLMWRLSM